MSVTDLPRILITGATGLLGWSLTREFSEGYQLFTPSRKEFDVLNPSSINAYIDEAKPDFIIHAAAYTSVDRAEEEPDVAMAVNGNGTELVAEEANRCGACIVYISTDYLFDGHRSTPYGEEADARPLSVYGWSKLAGEEAVSRISENYMIIRTAWIFGPGKPNFVMKMAMRAGNGTKVRVVNDQIGSPTYTPHLASAIRKLCEGKFTGLVNIVNEGSSSWYDLTREIYRMSGASSELVEPVSSDELGRPARRPAYSVLSTDKYRSVTGESLPDWKDALKAYFQIRESWEG